MLPASHLHTDSRTLNTLSHITHIYSQEPSVVKAPCLPLIAFSQQICSKNSISCKVTHYLDQQWLQRRSVSRKFTVTRHQAWAPQETIQASGICVPLIDKYNNYSPHYHHHRRLTPIHQCCLVARSQSHNDYIVPGSEEIHQHSLHLTEHVPCISYIL